MSRSRTSLDAPSLCRVPHLVSPLLLWLVIEEIARASEAQPEVIIQGYTQEQHILGCTFPLHETGDCVNDSSYCRPYVEKPLVQSDLGTCHCVHHYSTCVWNTGIAEQQNALMISSWIGHAPSRSAAAVPVPPQSSPGPTTHFCISQQPSYPQVCSATDAPIARQKHPHDCQTMIELAPMGLISIDQAHQQSGALHVTPVLCKGVLGRLSQQRAWCYDTCCKQAKSKDKRLAALRSA